jgi:hypothetical protein
MQVQGHTLHYTWPEVVGVIILGYKHSRQYTVSGISHVNTEGWSSRQARAYQLVP